MHTSLYLQPVYEHVFFFFILKVLLLLCAPCYLNILKCCGWNAAAVCKCIYDVIQQVGKEMGNEKC